MDNIIPGGRVLGCDEVGQGMTVYYGYIGAHSFNLQELKTLDGSKVDYTLFLDGNMEQAYFTAEPEARAKQMILELARR